VDDVELPLTGMVLLRTALVALPATLLAALCGCSVSDLTSGSAPDAASGALEAAAGMGSEDGSDASIPEAGGDMGAGGDDAASASDVAWDTSSWAAPAGSVLLQNALNHEYLDIADASLSDNAQVVTAGLTARSDQYWKFNALGDTSYEIVNSASGKCLDDQGGIVATGTFMIQFTCAANANQRWYLVNNQGNLTIVGQLSGKCLASQSLANPDVVIIGDCSKTSLSQQWSIPH
jgi:hypothetical protein